MTAGGQEEEQEACHTTRRNREAYVHRELGDM